MLVFSPAAISLDLRACTAPAPSAEVKVAHVIDGDTVTLSSGDKLRLIGVDTPELGNHKNAPETGATLARSYLSELLNKKTRYHVLYGQQKRDKYHRLLGHLFLRDGTNIQALLLARGLALPLTIPPNSRLADCYNEYAQQAIDKEIGLWALPEKKITFINQLSENTRGYRRIQGQVSGISESASSIWINFGPTFAARIQRKDLIYFHNLDLFALENATLEVRGHVYRRNKQSRMRLSHSVDLIIHKK